MATLAACVVNYDGERRIASCLDALIGDLPDSARVVVVDNASTDGSVERIRAGYPNVEIVSLPVNVGPAGARNAGYRAIRADRVLFTDNDVVLVPGCVERLMAALEEDGGAALAMPRTLRADEPGTIDFEGASSHLFGQLIPEHAGEPAAGADRPTREAGSLISSCFLLDRRRWGDEPLFDESFPFNYEDHELGLRSRLSGRRILVVPGAECLHGSGTPGASVRRDAPYPVLRVRSLIAGRWQILLVLYQTRTLALLAPALALYEGVQLLGAIRRGWFLPWLRAAGSTLRRLPFLLSERRAVQRRRVASDRDLLVAGPLPFRSAFPRGRVERAVLSALDTIIGAYVAGVGRFL